MSKLLQDLLQEIDDIAKAEFDGHYTILQFTTNVRVGFRTPYDREDIENVKAFSTLRQALEYAVVAKPKFY